MGETGFSFDSPETSPSYGFVIDFPEKSDLGQDEAAVGKSRFGPHTSQALLEGRFVHTSPIQFEVSHASLPVTL